MLSPAEVEGGGGVGARERERRVARGVASGSLKGRRLRDLGSLVGVRGAEPDGSADDGRGEELGGSESGLESTPYGLLEAMTLPPSAREESGDRKEAGKTSAVNLKR